MAMPKYRPPAASELWRRFDMADEKAIMERKCGWCDAKPGSPCTVAGTSRPAYSTHSYRRWGSSGQDAMRTVAMEAILALEWQEKH